MAYIKPDSITWTKGKGFYSGAQITITGNSSYKYVYVADTSKNYTYYLKTSSFSGTYTFTLEKDTSYSENYKYIQVTLANQSYANSTTFGDATKVGSCKVPRLAAKIYNASSSWGYYDSVNNPNLITDLSISPYQIWGFATGSTVIAPNYYVANSINNTGWLVTLNGKTLYTIHKKDASSFTGSYYCGSQKRETTVDIAQERLYGTGKIYGGEVTLGTVNTTCSNNSSYKLQGWAISKTTTVKYTNIEDAFAAGNLTIYGIYYKAGSGPTTSTVYYYRGSSAKQSVSETVTTTNGYYYYTGTKKGGTTTYTYGTINTSCLGDSSYSLEGWTGDSNSTTVEYEDAEDALRHYNTIYGIYSKTESMTYYPQNGNSFNSTPSITNYRYGDSNQITSNIPVEPSLTYNGYTLQGWATSSSGTASTWAAQWNAGARTVYAIWKANTYSITISYDANGGTGAPSASTGSGNVGSNINIQISSTKPTKDRHIFKGWADGNSTTVSYQSGQTYPFSSNKTLYAVWENKFGADNVYYGINGEWKLCEVYYGLDGKWVPIKTYYGNDNKWKNNT